MKRLNGVHNDKVELEIIECDCGYHMGIDASFVDQVDHAFFDVDTHCPSCGEKIPVRDLLEMEPIEVIIPVIRTSCSHRDLPVKANSFEEANAAAIAISSKYVFPEESGEYDVAGVWLMK